MFYTTVSLFMGTTNRNISVRERKREKNVRKYGVAITEFNWIERISEYVCSRQSSLCVCSYSMKQQYDIESVTCIQVMHGRSLRLNLYIFFFTFFFFASLSLTLASHSLVYSYAMRLDILNFVYIYYCCPILYELNKNKKKKKKIYI